MDVREKLAELIAKAKAMYADDYTDHTEDEYIAETLLDNFVTVLDGKPLEAFLHPIDAYKGLKAKYLVFEADTGEKVDDCFILRPDKDHSAVEALRAYAKATDNEILAGDIFNWVGKGVTVHEWISVDDRLPDKDGCYIVTACDEGCSCGDGIWYDTVVIEAEHYKGEWSWNENGTEYDITDLVTHWQPMPKPPKGE